MSNGTTFSTEQKDEYFLDTPPVRAFIGEVRQAIARQGDVSAVLDSLQPQFAALLADQSWLSDEFAAPNLDSSMGGGIGTWLLFRAGDHSLSLFSLVVPSGSQTPVHDHLAWGFVGLYRGEQAETVYERTDEAAHPHQHDHDNDDHQHHHDSDYAHLEVAEVNALKPGSFYKLLPPDGDIHAVKTTSSESSISIHLLANDTGCVVRHAFDLENDHVRSFRSGYSNVPCREEDEAVKSS